MMDSETVTAGDAGAVTTEHRPDHAPPSILAAGSYHTVVHHVHHYH